MNQEIEAHLSECHPCATFQEKQPKKTLLNEPVSNVPWKSLVMDNFNSMVDTTLLLLISSVSSLLLNLLKI